VQLGDVVGPYRVERQIGAGGMGEVWLAQHTQLGRPAAVKVLHANYAVQPEVVKRFFNEARAAAAIADPGIVQIYEFGQEGDIAYIAMELLDGETLDVRRARGIALVDAVRIMRQVASSLGAAHARGIIHRDLKPENIFLVRDPEVPGGERPKILDFGIAKLQNDDTVKTGTHAVLGTPLFMSPEQCRGAGRVDARSDVYSLGCVLFTLLAGRPVFIAEGTGELIVKHITEPAPRASEFAFVPPALDDLIARCLEKEADRRFASARELAMALAVLVTDPQLSRISLPAMQLDRPSSQSVLASGVGPAPTTISGSSVVSMGEPPPRRGLRIGLFAAGLTAIGLIVTVAVSRGGGGGGETTRGAAGPGPATIDAAVQTQAAAPIDAAPRAPPDAAPLPVDAAHEVEVDAAPPPVDAATKTQKQPKTPHGDPHGRPSSSQNPPPVDRGD
jgi:serine/threonine-protein kinase